MLAKVVSSATLGVEAYRVEVEADIQQQLPAFITVGLPDGAVRESKERVTSAIKNSDFVFPAILASRNDRRRSSKESSHAYSSPPPHRLFRG